MNLSGEGIQFGDAVVRYLPCEVYVENFGCLSDFGACCEEIPIVEGEVVPKLSYAICSFLPFSDTLVPWIHLGYSIRWLRVQF